MSTMPPPPPAPDQQWTPPPAMTAAEAKAQAKAAKAHAKALRPWYRKKRWWLLAALVVLIAIIVASGGGGDDGNESGVSTGFGTKDASADVTSVELQPVDAIGRRPVKLVVTNNSSKRSNYLIELAAESPDGKTQHESTFAAVRNVEPGQTAQAEAISFGREVPADAVVKVKTVSRTASN